MSRLKGFTAYDSVSPTMSMAPALQLLCKEHAKLRKGMEDVWEFAGKASSRDTEFVMEWLVRERKLRQAWELHTGKEERVLLGALSKYVDSDRGPLAVMKYEHELMENLFDKLEEDMNRLAKAPDNEALYQEVMQQFRNACQIKGNHCYKEENSTFSLAQSLLSESEKVLILQLIRKMKH
ncbi:MAG: Hemerythrin cation binding domain protein [Paenibacillaceae bacterium]|jgi:iron-sulfur cluster repair protein YtfE (RIC family)|nr:Hemerythrin cation binding domain protein [Paenibacillaceae bacterium]